MLLKEREKIIKAWRDPKYRATLSVIERETLLPPHPSGFVEFSVKEKKLEMMACNTYQNTVGVCCTG